MSTLWYNQPAEKWSEALPIGNGRIGGMVFGRTDTERIALNEDSIWYGRPINRINPDAKKNLPKVRELIFAGQIPQAEELLKTAFSGIPESERPYQTLGNLNISFLQDGIPITGEVTNYRRSLDLFGGICEVSYEQAGRTFIRTAFVSHPDQVLVLHFKSDRGVSFATRLERDRFYDEVGPVNDGIDGCEPGQLEERAVVQQNGQTLTTFMQGSLGDGGIRFYTALMAVPKDGKAHISGEYLVIEDATEVTLYLAVTATYRYGIRIPEGKLVDGVTWKKLGCQDTSRTEEFARLREVALKQLQAAQAKGYGKILAEHLKDFMALSGKVSLTLGKKPSVSPEGDNILSFPDNVQQKSNIFSGILTPEEDVVVEHPGWYGNVGGEDLPTDERIRRFAQGHDDAGLLSLYFDYGRYLLISSSRPGTLPATLQGIWNESMRPAWDSKYTININTEMNYWPAEACGLSDCTQPLFDMLEKMSVNGEVTAREMYDCGGFCAHHNTDIWADTAPQDIWIPGSYWVMSPAWLCTHIWSHYEYTLDKEWLKTQGYPILEKAVTFYLDYLVEHDGYYMTCPSVSPENTYIMPDGTQGSVCPAPTMDNELLTDLFAAYLEAGKVLGICSEHAEQVEEVRKKLPPLRIGKHGQLMEWLEDYEEAEPGHRHVSHLYGLYPSHLISRHETPELAKACEVTLERRLEQGGGYTGWSCGWLICLYARLGMGE
ncbi:MAG: glycoside hydrolase family 95 protein, partial [Lachnospiraceae bacterium]|nr:glycoside hydrolase family 95 protein [Lachnospiraceae bacterium]